VEDDVYVLIRARLREEEKCKAAIMREQYEDSLAENLILTSKGYIPKKENLIIDISTATSYTLLYLVEHNQSSIYPHMYVATY
jgi:hypothetical protein